MKIFLSLGSNIGNRIKNITKSINLISIEADIDIISKSKIYETSPMEYLNQDFFLNQVIEIQSNLEPYDLLKISQEIENQLGRKKERKKYMPRVIDIDILAYSNLTIKNKDLFIPHPKIKFRKFILKPWTDISPDYILPNGKSTIKELLDNIIDLKDEVKEYV